MPITERGTLGPGFERRLKLALDSVVPSAPLFARYFSTTPAQSSRPLRFASALLGIGAVGIMALSAVAATGSPNPAVWTQRAASSIQSVSHIPQSPPSTSPSPDARLAAPVSQQTGTSHVTPPTSRQAGPSDKAQPTARPQGSRPADETTPADGSRPPDPSEHPSPSPEPSDSPGRHQGQDPTPSPPPHDQGGDSHGH